MRINCIYAWVHACIYVCMSFTFVWLSESMYVSCMHHRFLCSIYECSCMYFCMHVYVYVCMHACIVCKCMWTSMYVYVYINVCVCGYDMIVTDLIAEVARCCTAHGVKKENEARQRKLHCIPRCIKIMSIVAIICHHSYLIKISAQVNTYASIIIGRYGCWHVCLIAVTI